jgi:phosphoglycolate phosphatase
MNIKMIIFDLDGTLIASLEGIQYSMNKILKEHNLPLHSLDEYRLFVGEGLKNLVLKALPENKRDESQVDYFYQLMMKTYDENYNKYMRLYDGISNLLNNLVQDGYKIAVNTNKNHYITQKIAKEHLNSWPFTGIIGSDHGFEKKPNPAAAVQIAFSAGIDPKHCIYVGDTGVDIETARNAGMTPVAVTWGFRKTDELESFNPDYWIDKPSELLDVIKTLESQY